MAGIKRPSSQLEPELPGPAPSLPSEPMNGTGNKGAVPTLAGSVQKKLKTDTQGSSTFRPLPKNAIHSVLDPHASNSRLSQVWTQYYSNNAPLIQKLQHGGASSLGSASGGPGSIRHTSPSSVVAATVGGSFHPRLSILLTWFSCRSLVPPRIQRQP